MGVHWILVSASSGEMRKRYGLIYVDRNDDGSARFGAGANSLFSGISLLYTPTVHVLRKPGQPV